MSKDKEHTLQKLKMFFKTSKSLPSLFVITPEIERELKPETPIAQRLRAIRDLENIVLERNLEDFAVQKLWDLTKDLIVFNKPAEQRQITLQFYGKLIKGQFKELNIMRAHFFKVIQNHNIREDVIYRLELLKILTDNGKDIQNFEEEIPKFMIDWMPEIIDAHLVAPFLEIFENLIKFNTTFLDRGIINSIILQVCLFCSSNEDSVVKQSLKILEAIIGYSVHFPNENLQSCVIALCRTVKETYCVDSHEIMKKLLSTQLGYASLLIMCKMLNDKRFYCDAELIRGAVFHIYIGLWGGNPNSTLSGLKYSSAVLLSYYNALDCEHIIVTYEVCLSIHSLIQKFGHELGEPSWDIIINILKKCLENLDKLEVPETNDVRLKFHSALDSIEELIHNNQINADIDKIYSLIESVAENRSEESVKKLLLYKFKSISVMRPRWLKNLHEFVERFYKLHPNPIIRILTIDYLKEVMETNRTGYEEEILDKVVIVLFSDIQMEKDIKIRTSVCSMLLDICLHCDSKRCLEILEILEKVLNRPFDIEKCIGDGEYEDIMVVVNGFIDLFLEKLHRLPSNHAIKIYSIMVGHLEKHYSNPQIFQRAKNVRYNVINWMLKCRANSAFQIGYPHPKLISNNYKFSYFLGVEGEFQHPPLSSETSDGDSESYTFMNTYSTLSIKKGCKIIVQCLAKEREKTVLQLLLRELPKIMQNKTLIQGNDINNLANALAEITLKCYRRDISISELTQSELLALIIPAMSSLFIYNNFLEKSIKQKITDLMTREIKMDSNKNLSICLQTFTILLMEKCEIVEKQLGKLLAAIAKVSATVSVSIPILEFVSTITHLPFGWSNLSEKEFVYIFASCLPYTSPARYDHYTVSLAHQIIARWFLKSRLQWRKQYAKYIIEGIVKNIQIDWDSNKSFFDRDYKLNANEDSTNRKRSSSLTEQGSKRKDPIVLQKAKELKQRQQENMKNFDMHNFHLELIETCIDFMVRHTFSLSSPMPPRNRLPSADFLLKGGQTQTWVVGSSLITITTSGCSTNPVKNGLCERCNSICKSLPQPSLKRSKDELNVDSSSSKTFSPFSGYTNSNSNSSNDCRMCACCCVGWAEVFIRRPTGNISWIMRIQNAISFGAALNEFTLHDLTTLFSQLDESEFDDDSKSTISSNQIVTPEPTKSTENISKSIVKSSESTGLQFSTPPIDIPASQQKTEYEGDSENGENTGDADVSFDDDPDSNRSRNQVRRVHSSPEMSSNWKNNFMGKSMKGGDSKDTTDEDTIVEESQQKKKSKDTKVSCEAIPEEITTMASSSEDNCERPVLYTSISATEPANVSIVPKKQFSADDSLQYRRESGVIHESRMFGSTLNRNTEFQKVLTKPPHIPQPLSPRILYKSGKQISMIETGDNEDSSTRGRSKTISVIGRDINTELDQRRITATEFSPSFLEQPTLSSTGSSGISPSFVFLQLYHSGRSDGTEKPLLVGEKQMTSMKNLDLIPPYERHKIGVVYVGKGQAQNQTEILRNRFGSLRYTQFLNNLGTLMAISDAKKNNFFMDLESQDGKFTYIWYDDIIQLTYHIATLMPNKESDPQANEKKKYIGNDYVVIVYNESGEEYNLNTIKGHFNYACIVIEPLELGCNLISIQTNDSIQKYFSHLEPKIVSDSGAPLFARQLALHADMASKVAVSLKTKGQSPYASNWLERWRQIKRLKERLSDEVKQQSQTQLQSHASEETTTTTYIKDIFTKYT